MDEVIEIIGNNESWGSPIINLYNGFLHPSHFIDGTDGASTVAVIGNQSIQIRNRYSFPLFLDRIVRIFWGFDENGILIEVYVHSNFGT